MGDISAQDETSAATEITLPQQLSTLQLAQLVAETTGILLEYSPEIVTGQSRILNRNPLTQAQLWATFNQSLMSQGLTTVYGGDPAVYRIIPVAELAQNAPIVEWKDLEIMQYPPGAARVTHTLTFISAEQAMRYLAELVPGTAAQTAPFANQANIVVLSGPLTVLAQYRSILDKIDNGALAPTIRIYRPVRVSPQSLQSMASAAIGTMGRLSGRQNLPEVQLTPDGGGLVMVGTQDALDYLMKILNRLDAEEIIETRIHRSSVVPSDELLRLLRDLQVLPPGGAGSGVVDRASGALIVQGTSADHERVSRLIALLEGVPSSARRQVQSFEIRYRPVDDILTGLRELIDAGALAGEVDLEERVASPEKSPVQPAAIGTSAYLSPRPPAIPTESGNAPVNGGIAGVHITADRATNRLIVVGDPGAMNQLAELLKQLDIRQPQVELEFVFVSLSEAKGRELGIELAGRVQRNEVSAEVGSLFGLSQQNGASLLDRQVGNGIGLGGLVVKPGDFVGVIRALETVTEGRSVIRSTLLVTNNGKATLNGVLQQPITSINAGGTIATTTVAGTADAGTQIDIQPLITAGDNVTLTFSVSQSAFIGSSTVVGGTLVPAPRRSDSVSSVITIPDGYVIALGGLSNQADSTSENGVPWISRVPVLGLLFKSASRGGSSSRFFLFIKASVYRSKTFTDLKQIGEEAFRASDAHNDRPLLKAAMVE